MYTCLLQMLLSAADRIAVKLTRSIALAMNTQGAYTSASGGTSASALSLAESQLHMDVALVAVLIATLFALVKRKPLLEILSAPTTSQIYEVCIHALVHPRLTAASTGAHVDQDILAVAKQILKGINTVILRLATDMPSDRSLVQLIPFMSRCTQASAQLTGSTLSEIAQPLSRLVRRVVLLETQAQNPFKQPHSAWHRVLESLHEYFNLIPSLINGPDNDKTFISTSASPDLMIATAQTVLSEIVQALGRAHTLGLLQVANLPSSAIIYRCVVFLLFYQHLHYILFLFYSHALSLNFNRSFFTNLRFTPISYAQPNTPILHGGGGGDKGPRSGRTTGTDGRAAG